MNINTQGEIHTPCCHVLVSVVSVLIHLAIIIIYFYFPAFFSQSLHTVYPVLFCVCVCVRTRVSVLTMCVCVYIYIYIYNIYVIDQL